MDKTLIEFGINSLVRLGRAGNAAAEQAARDRDALFPELIQPNFNALIYVNQYFAQQDEEIRDLVTDDGIYASLWDSAQDQAIEEGSNIESLLLSSIKIETERGSVSADPRRRSELSAASLLVAQWDESSRPASPWAKLILTAADIVLDYIGSNPEILDVGGQGERLIGAFAAELSELIPDDGDFGVAQGFAARLGTTFLRAGLATVVTRPDWIVSEHHVQALIKHSMSPLLDAFPASLTQQLVWNKLSEAIMGPVASAAFQTMAEHQDAFLTEDFAANKAVGAVAGAVFLQLADTGLSDQFSRDGIIEIYSSVLEVIAEKPSLFLGSDSQPRDVLARDMLKNLATVVIEQQGAQRGLSRNLIATAISVVGSNAQRFIDPDQPWDKMTAELVTTLSGSISVAITQNQSISTVLSTEQTVELGRIVLRHIGQTPALIAANKENWEGIITAVATAMEADKHLLLSGDDWLQIAAVAAREASLNPQRLFRPGANEVLAGKLMSVLVEAASEAMNEPDSARRSVLYGETLREVLKSAIEDSFANAQAVRDNLENIKTLAVTINDFVNSNHEEYGSVAWLCIFRTLLKTVLDGADVPQLDSALAREILRRTAS